MGLELGVKVIPYYSYILIGFIGLGRTLNNSVRLIEYILEPIKISNGTIYYGQLFNVIVIYIGLRGLLKIYSIKKQAVLKAVVMTVITIIISVNIWNQGIKLYMSQNNDLTSIYNYNSGTDISLDTYGGVITVNLCLENCSNEKQTLYIKTAIPDEWKEYITDNLISIPREYVINAREKIEIREEVEIELNQINDVTGEILYSEEVIFELINDKNERRVIKHVY